MQGSGSYSTSVLLKLKQPVQNIYAEFLMFGELVDVTLSCECKTVKAHKVVLASASSYFRQIFRNKGNFCSHHIVLLKDIKLKQLLNILYLIYFGEVRIAPDEVDSFCKAAQQLQITGLEFPNNSMQLPNIPIPTPLKIKQYASSFNTTDNEWDKLNNRQLAFHAHPIKRPFPSSEEKLISSVGPQITLPNSKDWPKNITPMDVSSIGRVTMQNNYTQKDQKRLVGSGRTSNLKVNPSSMMRVQARLNEYKAKAAITLPTISNRVSNNYLTPKHIVVFSNNKSLEAKLNAQRLLIPNNALSDKVHSFVPKKISKSSRLASLMGGGDKTYHCHLANLSFP